MHEALKKLRILNNYSQSYLAEYLKVSRQMYIKYENGVVEPPVKIVKELCRLYKVSYSTILGPIKKDVEFSENTEDGICVASPGAACENRNEASVLQIKAINEIKCLPEIQILAVMAYIKLLKQEISSNRANKSYDADVDPIEVEKINAVYDKISREEQVKSVKAGSKAVCEALKNDSW